MKEHILIIGAGAVGQVYAYHLAQAGYHIHFLLKEKYLEEAQQGNKILPLLENTVKLYRKAVRLNLAEEDMSAIIKIVEKGNEEQL